MAGEVEQRSVELAAVQGGLQLQAGHPVVLIVAGLHGTKQPGRAAPAGADEAPDAPDAAPGEAQAPADTAASAKGKDVAAKPVAAEETAAPQPADSKATPKPPRAKAAQEKAAIEPSPEDEPQPLTDPEWFHDDENDSFHHGDDLGMRVKAPGLDGRKVRFFVEHNLNGTWAPFLTAEAEVASGVAQAELHAQHPAAHMDHEDLDAAELRFRAWLV